jgi:hypothetical protein
MARRESRSLWKKVVAAGISHQAVWQSNAWLVNDILGVDSLEVTNSTDKGNKRYVGTSKGRVVCDMTIPDDLPLQDKVTVLRTAIRMTHGSNPER